MASERYYGPLGEVYTENPGIPIPSGTGFGFLGYGNAEVIFPTLDEWQAYQGQMERRRQGAALVIAEADQNLRNEFGELLAGASARYDRIEFMVITETGEKSFFGNRKTALEWARSQNKMCAVGEIRGFQIINLPEEEIAARVAAL
jgi:hypothetical protein